MTAWYAIYYHSFIIYWYFHWLLNSHFYFVPLPSVSCDHIFNLVVKLPWHVLLAGISICHCLVKSFEFSL
uniref:Uncharacterized protein n=1 Tax=Rhizophora mucronata TaxID=61149 RepID=A0A2P2QQQ0_RHIMU